MKKDEYKVFEDSVHGNIPIPKNYCKEIIDTCIFQRLRRIEQTSMRPLFPSAHHDRFIHSLGTYHIGRQLFSSIRENTEKYSPIVHSMIEGKDGQFKPSIFLQSEENNFWPSLEKTYQLACLLHDCGHAPFSHTFEKYYYNEFKAVNDDVLTIPLNKDLIEEYSDCVNSLSIVAASTKNKVISDFKRDLVNCRPNPHELVSSWLVLHKDGFRNALKKLNANPLLIARMIIGCKFRDSINNRIESCDDSEQILNCFISLLNGHEIDSDRLDYLARDTWATGLNTVKVNLNRIYSSIYITNKNKDSKDKKFVICFRRKCISELHTLLDVKNFTNFWIFNHPKIKYNEDLLIKAVKKLALLLSSENETNDIENYFQIKSSNLSPNDKSNKLDSIENNAMYRLFNYKSIIKPIEYVVKIDDKKYYDILFLMSDDDIIHLLKKYFCSDIKTEATGKTQLYLENATYAIEWLSRKQYLIPIWKSYAEYNTRYFTPFALELELINLFKISIESLSEADKNNINIYFQLLEEKKLKEHSCNIKNFREKSAIEIILEYHSKNNNNQEDLHKNVLLSIEKAKLYYSEKDSYEKLLRDISSEIISEIKDDNFTLKPDTKTAKVINIETLDIKEIRKDSIFVEIQNEIYCYTSLNLPLKNQAQRYNFFYVFMPRIFDNNGIEEISNDQYFEKFKKRFQGKLYAN